MKYPKVCIIILNWNGLKDTLECLDSILGLDYENYNVIVVDNGSLDRSVEIIRERFPSVIMIESNRNLGYTGGNNIGIQYALEHSADYIWLLNNDTIISADCLRKMVEIAETDPQIGLLSPVIYYENQRDRMQFCGTVFNKASDILLTNMKQIELSNAAYDRGLLLWGTALLIKRCVIATIGCLDDLFFAYFEDIDYSLRARKKGFKTAVVSSAKIYHKDASSSGGKNSPVRVYYYMRNLNLLWKKHLKGAAKLSWQFNYIKLSIATIGFYKKNGMKMSETACFDGIWDGISNLGGALSGNNKMPIQLKKLLFICQDIKKKVVRLFCSRPAKLRF
jgi:GT2 family glycosyltransferase